MITFAIRYCTVQYVFRWRDAESNATKALQAAPKDSEARFRRGLALTELHQWGRARQGKRVTKFFDTDLIRVLDIQAFLDSGGCSVKGKAVLEAIARFEAASISSPVNDKSDNSSEALDIFRLGRYAGFAVRDSKIGGKGVFATREFKAGDEILTEEPLLTVEAEYFDDFHGNVEVSLQYMSPDDLARFLSLHNQHTSKCCASQLPHRASEIYQSNFLKLTDKIAGIGFYASRFNHSCAPNACHEFDPDIKKLKMRALSPISEGQEIFISYNGEDCTHPAPRAERQAELRKRYHFTCACAECTARHPLRLWLCELVDRIFRAVRIKKAVKSGA